MWRLCGSGERKFIQMVMVTWPRCSPCPYIVKILKIFFSRTEQSVILNLGIQHPDTRLLPNSFKWRPWVDLDLFYGNVKFGPFCFCMGKSENNWFLAHLSWRLTRWAYSIAMVRRPSVVVVHTFKPVYLWSQLANLDQILCVASLEWGKGCIRFWGRLDQNSGFHGNRKPP